MVTVSNDFGDGLALTCILEEGAPTVGKGYTTYNARLNTVSWAGELYKGEIVIVDSGTDLTHEATQGLPVVRRMVAGDAGTGKIIGIITSDPQLQANIPNSAAADTRAERLAGEYYRTGTVKFFGLTGVAPGTLKTTDTAAVVPGVVGTLAVDQSASVGGKNGFIMNDVASGGANVFSFHYQAKAAGAEVPILMGMLAGGLTVQA